MAWSQERSQGRIDRFLQTVPKNQVSVRILDEGFITERRSVINERARSGGPREQFISNLSRNAAVLVDGAHVYAQLLDFGAAMMEQDRETEASHRRVLGMLHLHYAACDSVADEFEAQRVDYHGPRMHAVIVSPAGPQNVGARARRALEFADALKRAIERTGDRVGNGQFRTRVRVGIDSGLSVAVNSGSRDEREPLFLGNPANYAAKLAEGTEEGLFPSNKVRMEAGIPQLHVATRMLDAERANRVHVSASSLELGRPGYVVLANRVSEELVTRAADAATARFHNEAASSASFTFHRHEPPLRTIVFADLSPSRSIRMELASIFGDIDRFTAYVEDCIRGGRVSEMVTNLHVIRSELAATLKHDFDGRKVRFIGDCIHGLLVEGSRTATNATETVRSAVKAAAGMRSSFELCQENLENVGGLGIAIGVEYGATPVSRIGIRGDGSVRCSVSKAVTASEELQSVCRGDETALGPRALAHAPAGIRRLFGDDGKAPGLDVDALASHLGSPAIVKSGTSAAVAAPYLNGKR
ncbi:adenylate/guanylate cyclase domain-containing protein [Methylopila sp. M107]|uniref:adenylate/guanylate cyclase domain-containing protein n=1 Tax=Methylopila sp. M107 TaxID=1101190 RepID=UPI0003797D7B|nr:adenylate/guanylate cyclase domain-containing protein [Methylopila sp. M107]